MRGTVKKYLKDRNFGFIESNETKSDVFFHKSITDEELEKGDIVEFEVENTDKGLNATSVKRV